MNLSWIDWAIMIVAVVGLRFVSLSTRSHMKGVADFLSANRTAGRYLLTIASQMGGTGAISIVALFEMYYSAGFTPIWWSLMSAPIAVIIALTGWVFYRFRETRALTMAQFFEMRYSRKFRIFAGILCWISGILNFGIFPAVAARFFIYFCGLPDYFHIPGIPLAISTFATVMIIDLGLALTFVTMGGQISIMITECAQGIVSCIAFVVISAAVLLQFQWPKIVTALATAPQNASMIHPFHTSQVGDFNVWYFLIGVFGGFYSYMAWQGTSGFNSSARTPHEQKMGYIIAIWRDTPKVVMAVVLPIVAYAALHLPEYSQKAAVINHAVANISNPAIQVQMKVPVALAHILPVGIKGLLATTMLFFSFTCHDTYMHSWGSIFVQDVVLPFRKKPISPEQHITWLRWSIVGVAVFSFFFSLLYPQSQKIFMFFAITGTIWLGGSGAVILGGLYWKKGTTPAAYASLIVGAVFGVIGLIIPEIYKSHYHKDFPVNGQWLGFFAMISAIIIYVIVSLATCRGREFDLDRMLHRNSATDTSDPEAKMGRWQRVFGITAEFSKPDKFLAIALVAWNLGWFALFGVVTVINLLHPLSNAWWAEFWRVYVWLYLIISIPATVWFTVGGLRDIKELFHTLDHSVRDHSDNGSVNREPETPTVVPDADMPVMAVCADSEVIGS